MSFVKLPSGDWVDLKLVRIIRTEMLYPGGARCTVTTEDGDLPPIPFDTLQEASDWMVGFVKVVSEIKAKASIFHTQIGATKAR